MQEKKISPRTYVKHQHKLEKWVTRERNELQLAKQDMQKGWRTTYDTVLRTQRDLIFMAKNLAGTAFTALANSFSHDSIS